MSNSKGVAKLTRAGLPLCSTCVHFASVDQYKLASLAQSSRGNRRVQISQRHEAVCKSTTLAMNLRLPCKVGSSAALLQSHILPRIEFRKVHLPVGILEQ